MGAMPGRVGGKARKKLCASVTSISPVVFNECATLYLVRIFSAARCAGFRQKKSPGSVGGKARKKLCASVTSISLVVSDERATLYLVRFHHVRRQWRIQHMGEHLGE